MNPYVSINWPEALFPGLISLVLGIQLWRRFRPREDYLTGIGVLAVLLALTGASVANLFYQRVLHAEVWPATGIFDQVIVTAGGDVLAKVEDPILGRAARVQRYNCRGKFMTAYQPDNAGGLFKIAMEEDTRLNISSARKDVIDVFQLDGAFVERQIFADTDKRADFMEAGPSVTKGDGCAFTVDPVSGQPAVRAADQIWSLQRGDWVLEYVLNGRNILGSAGVGIALLVVCVLRARRQPITG